MSFASSQTKSQSNTQSNSGSNIARILSISATQQIIIPTQQALELIETPDFDIVPGLVDACLGFMVWQNRRIPLVDIESYLTNQALSQQTHQPALQKKYVLIVRYHDDNKTVQYAGITCHDIPESVTVTNDIACDLPAQYTKEWQSISPACVVVNNLPTPIVSVKRLLC